MDGVSPDPENVQALIHWPKLQTMTELRVFLGLVDYYRRYNHDFAKIASPLNQLLCGHSTLP